jgi:hypothetical protein
MTLNDNIWQSLEGGYRMPYDASVPLRRLEEATNNTERESIFEELWDELHHQGDVGIASYLSLPQLVRIAKAKNLFDWNVLGLCAVIEQQKQMSNNPELPKEFSTYYQNGLNELKLFILANLERQCDSETFRIACSALATVSGEIKLGKAIIELEGDTMDEFLEQFQ